MLRAGFAARRVARAPVMSRALRTTGARFADEAPAKPAEGTMELTFTAPDGQLFDKALVEMVILPGGDGLFGVMPNYVPTIAELKPGIVSVQEASGGPLSKYFVSGGFASSARAPRLSPPRTRAHSPRPARSEHRLPADHQHPASLPRRGP